MTESANAAKPDETRASLENPQTSVANPEPWLIEAFGATPSSSGVLVSEIRALNCTAVYRAVGIISGTIGSLPLVTYQKDAAGWAVAEDHPAFGLLCDVPNPDMTTIVFRETLQAFALLWGNGYAGIERDYVGNPIALWPVHPRDVKVGRVDGRKYYQVRRSDGGGFDYLSDFDILHIPGLGFDGLAGFSVIQMMRQAVGLALGAEEFGARYFGNGAPPGTVIEAPGTVSAPAIARLKASWNQMHQGPTNAHRTAILEEGMKVNNFGINPDDAQFLETRKFQNNEIARFFGVPPHLLGDLERATFSNIEQQALDFAKYGLRRWLIIWEQETRKKLVSPEDRKRYRIQHDLADLLQGDIESRYRAYATGRQWGFINVDEIRDRENMNRLPNGQGQTYLVPVNMMAASAVQTSPSPIKPPADSAGPDPQRMAQWQEAVRRLLQREQQAAEGADDTAIDQRLADHAEFVEWVFSPLCQGMDISARQLTQRYIDIRSRGWRAFASPDELLLKLEIPCKLNAAR